VSCGCIKGNYSFYVEALDKDTLIYQDLSEWMEGDSYEFPTTYEVTIIPPASATGTTLELLVSSTNKITSEHIGAILDGIYCFKVESCGVEYKRSIALFPWIECCVKQAWATLDQSYADQIREIERQLKLSKINSELNNVKFANSNLKIAKKLLENLKCDCNC
jgi:hypothetical protein